ncbi:bifunctional phosphopantothenoylcysteine decarboxylase/phosphopantothenate--cysteine ligase CoaBC [Halosegnis rubeus]|jgi:phosphopantothenoylcysteine decarboxylase/phosphopantothenate--cysteine ligase|uniref:Coenzyme A biosynthesis bifunctional protein CoaBC n=1 Tax=Halosegnis rubeus TaxID=2212850 RepID=A0A5N5UF27_9EURY|nr:bifunctional phosphopantothenoylcysteine decarboxylase/phosphopantothenate--cysteine ligase CoaBC [Halosegnis rubeus]KAB7513310.1 bifunctional phosphopantothenoylcysteine decarboxylase/phosphopantothenate--cysteine ligase CoaBC [Halosegnis rubeus]KAB7517293.1 bifunctional phosphopantothenoylcysteine decarboxylase/phosphopantothenate--cysteine ligase CoaBC [Halosegnis rubeus]
MSVLADTNVVLGVSGSIAAVKTVELAHELRREGANVTPVMTDSARGIIHPWALEFATENEVVTEITGKVEHVDLFGADGWADVFLLAPATANTVGKIAAGIDDTTVTTCATTALGQGVPLVVAPAMHEPMYDHPGVLDSLDTLESWGVTFVDPRLEEGKAKIATEEAIVTTTARVAGDSPLAGQHVVVTSGPTSETIDPVRVLTNRASGKTGRALARACYVRGADVTLLHDGTDVPYASVERVESAAEMTETAVEVVGGGADALVSAAAISDYTIEASDEKIRSGGELTLELEPTPKLLDTVRASAPDLTMVGFKLETEGDDERLVATAREQLARVGLSFVVANRADALAGDETRVIIVREAETTSYTGPKTAVANDIADELAVEL